MIIVILCLSDCLQFYFLSLGGKLYLTLKVRKMLQDLFLVQGFISCEEQESLLGDSGLSEKIFACTQGTLWHNSSLYGLIESTICDFFDRIGNSTWLMYLTNYQTLWKVP
jgi:hypothetical protein